MGKRGQSWFWKPSFDIMFKSSLLEEDAFVLFMGTLNSNVLGLEGYWKPGGEVSILIVQIAMNAPPGLGRIPSRERQTRRTSAEARWGY